MYFAVMCLPLANASANTFTPALEAPVTVTEITSDLPVSRVTMALKPATLLVTLGRPEKLYPVTVMFPFLPFVTDPTTRSALGADEIVTVVADEIPVAYGIAAALVAVTMHVPPVVAVSAPFVIVQPVAVPLVTVKVTTPVPEPPLVASAMGASR